jgi:SAM-dependent methyltransferase
MTPNQHALPAQVALYPSLAVVGGYQNFTISPWSLIPAPENTVLMQKLALIRQVLTPETLHTRTVLDLGASAGFFAFWAARQGAASALCVDMDQEYVELTRKVVEHLGIDNLQSVHANVDAWDTPADVVIALALVHWLYSCTSVFGSLDAVVGKLASLARHLLIVEWIGPEDEALSWFGHTGWNSELTDGTYDLASFEAALGKHFARYRCLGTVMPHRTLYVAYTSPYTIDAPCPLPLLGHRGEVISSRLVMPFASLD